jgi:hypothetical protein
MSTYIRFRVLYLTLSSGLTLFEAFFQNKKRAVPRDGYFLEGLNILIRTSGYALMVFKLFQRFFTILYNYPPQNSLLCDWSMFSSSGFPLVAQVASGLILQNHKRLP